MFVFTVCFNLLVEVNFVSFFVFLIACCVVTFACINNLDEKSMGILAGVLKNEANKHGFDVRDNGEHFSRTVFCEVLFEMLKTKTFRLNVCTCAIQEEMVKCFTGTVAFLPQLVRVLVRLLLQHNKTQMVCLSGIFHGLS